MNLDYNEELNLYTCTLTYEDWLNEEIIREYEDGEFLYENGQLTNKLDPTFRRKKISEYIGLWDCENGWEVYVRGQGLTRFMVFPEIELEKVKKHLESMYWGLVDKEFNHLKYYIEQQIDYPGLRQKVSDEIDKVKFGLSPNSFHEEPVLVKYMEPRERKIFDRLPKIYAEIVNDEADYCVPYRDAVYVYEHYRVDAMLKYLDWLYELQLKLDENKEPKVSTEANEDTTPYEPELTIDDEVEESVRAILMQFQNNFKRSGEYEKLVQWIHNHINGKTPRIDTPVQVTGRVKTRLASALGHVHRDCVSGKIRFEYLELLKSAINIYENEKLDRNTYLSSNLYKMCTSK